MTNESVQSGEGAHVLSTELVDINTTSLCLVKAIPLPFDSVEGVVALS